MKSKPNISLKIGAAYYSLSVSEGGRTSTFDFSKLSRAEKRKIRSMTVQALDVIGYFGGKA